MKRLGTVTFDFLHCRIKLGNVWEQYEATVQGATPLVSTCPSGEARGRTGKESQGRSLSSHKP